MPTGGLNAKNIGEYLAEPKIIACGGSFMVPKDQISAHNWDKIRKITEDAVRLMLSMTFIGITEENGRKLSVMKTPNIRRAKYHLERQGVRFDGDTAYDLGLRLVEK